MKTLLFVVSLFALAISFGAGNAYAQQGSCLETPKKSDCPPCLRKKGEAGASGGVNWCNERWRGPQKKK